MGIIATVTQTGPTTSRGDIRSHSVVVDRPAAKGGVDAGMMGGEMLLVALGGCFMSNLLEAIRARGAAISGVQTEVEGTLAQNPPRFTAIEMRVSADTDDTVLFDKLVTISERSCINANTLRGGVELTVRVVKRAGA